MPIASPRTKNPQRNSSTILLIDDSEDLLQLWSLILASEGFSVVVARNGYDGLRLAREGFPSVIVTDYMMPGLDGLAVCESLKADAVLSHIPVILWTAANPPESSHSDMTLQKPVAVDVMLKHICALIMDP